MDTRAIELRRVVKHFGPVRAVDSVDLSIETGELFGLIGHNGAGKSTLFKMLLGLLEPDQGQILIGGQAMHGPSFRELRRGLGYLPENVAFYDNLSGLETLQFFAKLKGAAATECKALLYLVGLAKDARRAVRHYSKGMRQRLGLAQALLGSPRLLLLDEPTSGLDPEGIRDFYRILHELKEGGATIVLSSHILSEIQERVDRLAIMRAGRVDTVGTVKYLRERLALPVWIDIQFGREARQRVGDLLAGLGTGATVIEDDRASVHCERHQKMAAIERLMSLGVLTELQIREPTLEDVFLGYAG